MVYDFMSMMIKLKIWIVRYKGVDDNKNTDDPMLGMTPQSTNDEESVNCGILRAQGTRSLEEPRVICEENINIHLQAIVIITSISKWHPLIVERVWILLYTYQK